MFDISTRPTPRKRRFAFGFYSINDLLKTTFGESAVPNAVAAVVTWLSYAAGVIYPDKTVVLILFLTMLFDWITGVYKAYKKGTFNSFTFQRMLLNMVLTFGLIAFATQYAASMWIFKFLRIHEVLMTGFMITYLVSVIENLHETDERLIPKKLYEYLKGFLNLDNVLKNYFKKEEPKPDASEESIPVEPTAATTADELPHNQNG